jgi:hypothetical protein
MDAKELIDHLISFALCYILLQDHSVTNHNQCPVTKKPNSFFLRAFRICKKCRTIQKKIDHHLYMSLYRDFPLLFEVLINTSIKHSNLNNYCNVYSLRNCDSTCRKIFRIFFKLILYILRPVLGTMFCVFAEGLVVIKIDVFRAPSQTNHP